MFSKILIANRGEIAHRIIRACKELGIETVAVYSEADAACLHLKLADEQVCIGPPVSAKSYLNREGIIKAAKETGAEAVHPGYGYLAESEEFARACEEQDLLFIGPTPQNLKLAGDKITAKNIIKGAGVPVIPSSSGGVGTDREAIALCEEIGYPVMIKASGGGGGRGIRVCPDEETLLEEFAVAKMEAARAALRHAASLGVTSMQTPCGADGLRLYDRLRRDGELTARLYAILDTEAAWQGTDHSLGDDWLHAGGIKIFADGSFGAGSALLSEPYEDDPTSVGLAIHEPAELNDLVRRADAAGLQHIN